MGINKQEEIQFSQLLKDAVLTYLTVDSQDIVSLLSSLNNIVHLWNSYFPDTLIPEIVGLEKTGKETDFSGIGIRVQKELPAIQCKIFVPISFSHKKRKFLLVHFILTRILEKRLIEPSICSETAFALLWDLSKDKSLLHQWKTEFPNRRSKYNPSIVLGLADFLISLDTIKTNEPKSHFFFDSFFELFLLFKRLPPEQAEFLPYRAVRVNFLDLTSNMLKVLRALCEVGDKSSLQEISDMTGLTRQTVSKIKRFLIQSHIITERTFFFPNSIGLGTYFLLWRSPTSVLSTDLFQRFPNVRSLKYFRGFDNVFLLEFLYPLDEKSETHMRIWSKSLIPKSTNPRGGKNEVLINGMPLFAVENEKYRFENLNLDLFDEVRKTWFFENSPSNFEFLNRREPYKTSFSEREAIKKLLEEVNFDTGQTSESHVGKVTTKKIIKILMENNILQRRYVISPLPDFVQYLVLFQTDLALYRTFISNVAKNLPISRVFYLDSVKPQVWERGISYGMAILFIPRNVLNLVLKRILNIAPHARLVTLPSSRGTSGKVDLKATKNGWSAPKLPNLSFIQSEESWF